MTYGEQIRNRRIRAGVSVKALADALGISSSMLCQVESGARHMPTDRMPKVASALLWDVDAQIDARIADTMTALARKMKG